VGSYTDMHNSVTIEWAQCDKKVGSYTDMHNSETIKWAQCDEAHLS